MYTLDEIVLVTEPTSPAVTVCLYLAIPERDEPHADIVPWHRRLRSFIRHSLKHVATRLSGRLHLDLYHYQAAFGVRGNSNRGDIAIRIAIKQQLTEAFAPQQVQFHEVRWGELTDAAASRINASCDIFVIGGGGYIFLHADGLAGHMLDRVEELGKIKCPVFAYGIGLNRLMHEKVCELDNLPESTRNKIRYLGKKCESISVRDAETARLFGLYSDNPVTLTGDPVLFHRSDKYPVPAQAARHPIIGINMAAHGWRALAVLKPLLPAFIAFLKQVQKQYGAEFVYLQHHELERPVIEFLGEQGLKFKAVYDFSSDLWEGYAAANFVICQMLHSAIFAACSGKPFLNIAYDHKSIAFCELLGLPECCIPHLEADRISLQERFSQLFDKREMLADVLSRRKKELHLAQAQFAAGLAAADPM